MRATSVPRHRVVLAATLAGLAGAALLLAGCQSDDADSGQATAPSNEESAAAEPDDRPAGGQHDDAPRTPRTPAAVQASDGTDLAACQDVDCQVELGSGDVLRPEVEGLPLDTITVENIEADRVELSMAGTTGEGMTLEGTDIEISSECVGDRCQDSGELTVTTETPGKINHVVVRLDDVRDDRAIVTFEPG